MQNYAWKSQFFFKDILSIAARSDMIRKENPERILIAIRPDKNIQVDLCERYAEIKEVYLYY